MLHFFMINFLKRNWALVILVVIGVIYLKDNYLGSGSVSSIRGDVAPMFIGGDEVALSPSSVGSKVYSSYSPMKQAAPSESTDRLIIQNTGLSLQVKDVAQTIDEIEKSTKEFGGFLISSNLSKPQGAASGNISVRVPEEKRKEAMTAYKKMAVKVVSESVNGNDVTDQYTDLQAQLEVLQKTKIKFEDILNQATKVSDLLDVQQQLISLQSQIDSVKGQQKYYEQSAKLSKVTIYLSTDELALPYAPTNEWRPTVVFKEAVRSFVGTIREIGSLLIWAVVFAPIIVPAFLIVRYIKKRRNNK